MIPKTLHQLWLSDDIFKKKYWQWRQSWMLYNVDWNFKLWTLKDLCRLPMPDECFKVLIHPGILYTIKTDVARWLPLFYEGGVYADTDMECLKPFYSLLNTGSFCGQSRPPDGYGNAIVGCIPGLRWLMEFALTTAKNILVDIDRANKEVVYVGVRYHGKELGICETIHPVEYFYPFSWQQKKADTKPNAMDAPNSYSVHHWTSLDSDGWTNDPLRGK